LVIRNGDWELSTWTSHQSPTFAPPLLIEVMFVVASEIANHFLREWAAAVRKYEEADREFERITAHYMAQADAGLPIDRLSGRRDHHKVTRVEAAHMAREDLNRKDAASARSHFAERATMYGISALVEITRGDHSDRR
jgi:hypothetical protein